MNYVGARQLPESRRYPDVPSHIGDAATEAFECQSSEHYRGAILLARAVIEATAKDRGFNTGTLHNKIELMATGGGYGTSSRTPHMESGQLGRRVSQNGTAHGDFVDPVSVEESRLVIRPNGGHFE